MPIFATCSVCSTQLTAPDAAAGKKIKCPKCHAVCSVPAPVADVPVEVEEEAEAEPEAKTSKPSDEDDERPRRKKRSAEDEDDADDERPRNRKRRDDDDDVRTRRRKEKRNTGSYGVLVVTILGVLVFAVVGFSIYWFGLRGKSANRDSEGWEIYTSPDNMFKVSFPGRSEPLEWKPVQVMTTTSELRIYRTGSKNPESRGLTFFAGYVRIPEDNKLGMHFVEANEVSKMLFDHMTPTSFGKHQGDSGEEGGMSSWVGGRGLKASGNVDSMAAATCASCKSGQLTT